MNKNNLLITIKSKRRLKREIHILVRRYKRMGRYIPYIYKDIKYFSIDSANGYYYAYIYEDNRYMPIFAIK